VIPTSFVPSYDSAFF